MLEIQRLRSDKEGVLIGLAKRNIDPTKTINDILEMDGLWRENKTQLENIA
jgi:seryl-tRNA synthetase